MHDANSYTLKRQHNCSESIPYVQQLRGIKALEHRIQPKSFESTCDTLQIQCLLLLINCAVFFDFHIDFPYSINTDIVFTTFFHVIRPGETFRSRKQEHNCNAVTVSPEP